MRQTLSISASSAAASVAALLVATTLLLAIDGSDATGQMGDPRATDPQEGQLIFVHVLYRHGDRTPIDPYPNDPWGNTSFWPTGWGQLTNVGKFQHYELGKYLRSRYAHLIGQLYDKERFYIQSTDVDRTLMSAESNLAGLWIPKTDQNWNPKLHWQPIPIHTQPETTDEILAAKRVCPAYEYALKKYKETAEYVALNRQYRPLYKYLTKHAGRKIDSFTDVNNLYNNLWIEELNNMTLPEWTKEVYPGDMAKISARSFATKTITPRLARLKGGFLLKDILHRFDQKISKSLKPDRSMWVYSAHDTTVANLLNTLRLFEWHGPPYAACVMLELRIVNAVPVVQVFYKNTTAEPSPMIIPGCGSACPLQRMFEIYADVLPGQFDDECKQSTMGMSYAEADLSRAMGLAMYVATIWVVCLGFVYFTTEFVWSPDPVGVRYTGVFVLPGFIRQFRRFRYTGD